MQTPRVLPKSALGQAVQYCRNQWDKLTAFLKDGRLELDNNRSERSIKPFIVGRKNREHKVEVGNFRMKKKVDIANLFCRDKDYFD
ncbi:MAG: Transposase family protein [Firmicutes bacterium]|nr:Transposase family protein [Bacillota bacterium]